MYDYISYGQQYGNIADTITLATNWPFHVVQGYIHNTESGKALEISGNDSQGKDEDLELAEKIISEFNKDTLTALCAVLDIKFSEDFSSSIYGQLMSILSNTYDKVIARRCPHANTIRDMRTKEEF